MNIIFFNIDFFLESNFFGIILMKNKFLLTFDFIDIDNNEKKVKCNLMKNSK